MPPSSCAEYSIYGGTVYGKIAAALNKEGIQSPRWYWATHYGNGKCKYAKLWTYATVKNLLNNEIYIGNLIQNRTGSLSYKDDTMIQKPEKDWIYHRNAFDAIIPKEMWEAVQNVNWMAKLRSVGNSEPKPCLFTGKLICADCKGPLMANRETSIGKTATLKSMYPISAEGTKVPARACAPVMTFPKSDSKKS